VLRTCTGSILGEDVLEITMWLIQSGIAQHFHQYYYWQEFIFNRVFEVESGPKVFSVEDVSYGFSIWLNACAISILGFVGEWIQVLVWKIFSFIWTEFKKRNWESLRRERGA
jgi:hypothetical protein